MRKFLAAVGALAAATLVILFRHWNRQLEAAMQLPEPSTRRHPSIPGSLDDLRRPPTTAARAKAEREFFKHAEMSLALARSTEPKVFCQSKIRSPRTGYVIASCSFHVGHENAHRDVHEGRTWTDPS